MYTHIKENYEAPETVSIEIAAEAFVCASILGLREDYEDPIDMLW